MQGRVKWFDDKKGYGFIVSQELDKEVFVHYSEIQVDGYKTMNEGVIVVFDYDDEVGKATNVRVVKNAESVEEEAK